MGPRSGLIGVRPDGQWSQGAHHDVHADEPQQLGGQGQQGLGVPLGRHQRHQPADGGHDHQVDPHRPHQPGDPTPQPRRVRIAVGPPGAGVHRPTGDEEQRHDLQDPRGPWRPPVDRQRRADHRAGVGPAHDPHAAVAQDHQRQGAGAQQVEHPVTIRGRGSHRPGDRWCRRKPHTPDGTPIHLRSAHSSAAPIGRCFPCSNLLPVFGKQIVDGEADSDRAAGRGVGRGGRTLRARRRLLAGGHADGPARCVHGAGPSSGVR